MFFLNVVLADLWGHVGRYDLRPQAMCIRPARAMRVLWFERVWSWELPTFKNISIYIYICFFFKFLDSRGSEMFFLYVVLAGLWGHVGRYDLRPLDVIQGSFGCSSWSLKTTKQTHVHTHTIYSLTTCCKIELRTMVPKLPNEKYQKLALHKVYIYI